MLNLLTGAEQAIPSAVSPFGTPSFSPDSRWLGLPSSAGWVKLWDVGRNRVRAELTGFVLGVHSAVFSPDNRRLITGSGGAEAIRVWDCDGFEPLLNLAAEGTLFSAAAFSRDGTTIGARNGAAGPGGDGERREREVGDAGAALVGAAMRSQSRGD